MLSTLQIRAPLPRASPYKVANSKDRFSSRSTIRFAALEAHFYEQLKVIGEQIHDPRSSATDGPGSKWSSATTRSDATAPMIVRPILVGRPMKR